MSTQDVTDAIYSDDDDDFDVDDPDEPFMDGSDDDFSDLEGELDDDDNDEDMDTDMSTPHSPSASPPAVTPPRGNSGTHTLDHTSAGHPTSYVDHQRATSHHHTIPVRCWSNCPCT